MDDQITIDPRICNGKPVISGTRIPVTVVLDQLAETGSVHEVLRRYPELSPEQVKPCPREEKRRFRGE